MTTLDHPVIASPSQLEILTEINIQDLYASLGMEKFSTARKAMRALAWLPARRFARQMVAFDQQVAEAGLGAASRRVLGRLVGRLEVQGAGNIPAEGPVLVLSNHPGMADTLALFSSLPRRDLRVLASERPFLQSLPNVSRHLIYVPDDPGRRMGVVRSTVSHLRLGGAVLTFPAGQIEPDPACMPGALESLQSWSESIAVFARLVPEVKIVLAVVSGVIWSAALHSPLTRLRRQQVDRERLAAAMQLIANVALPFYRPLTTRVVFSLPFRLATDDPHGLMQAVREQVGRMIEQVKPVSSALQAINYSDSDT